MSTMTDPVTILRSDQIACRWCGVAVPEGDGGRWFAGHFGADGLRSAGLGVCDRCAEMNERAVQIADALPADERAALGESPAHRIAELVRAMSVLGTDEPILWEPVSFYLKKTRVVRSLDWIEQYKDGGLARRQEACAAAPFSWVDPRRVRAAFDAAAAEAAAVGEPHTVRLPPPVGGGCAFCGLDGIDADAQAVYRAGGPQKAARDAWRSKRQGKQRWACPPCASVGGVNPAETARLAATAAAGMVATVEEARRTHLLDGCRHTSGRPGSVRLPAVPPWFSSGAEPSRDPWAHVGGIAAVRQAVVDALNPPPPPPTLEELAERVERLERLLAG